MTASGGELSARQWGGEQTEYWTGFKPPADLKSIADAQLNELQPLFAAMLRQQAVGLLTHLEVAR
ncbi:MAG: hypothetical protein E6K46_11015 [Gammaproteobacteria bacterium]|nr:MAG: hypothetical protein E6K46_11015 [Gammaproteobacteria bacterium]